MKNSLKKMKGKITKTCGDHRGYALLFAVLVSAIVLGVGVSILNVARKELLLTTGAQQSQYAFYAADTGYECAVYQDLQDSAFTSTTTGSNPFDVYCGATYVNSIPSIYSSPVTVTEISGSGNVGTSQYEYTFNVPVSAADSCAAVTVTKTYTTVTVGSTTSTSASTSVLSDGFNIGWESSPGDCNASSQSKVERALLANY